MMNKKEVQLHVQWELAKEAITKKQKRLRGFSYMLEQFIDFVFYLKESKYSDNIIFLYPIGQDVKKVRVDRVIRYIEKVNKNVKTFEELEEYSNKVDEQELINGYE